MIEEPVTVWGTEREPKLSDASAEMAAGYIDASEVADTLYVVDAVGNEFMRNHRNEWVPAT